MNMETVRHNLDFFDSLDNNSSPLNIRVENNRIIINDHSWLRSSSVEPQELFHVIQWTFDNAIINFWEHFTMDNWLSETYRSKFHHVYNAFVSLQYVYEKCKQADYPLDIQSKLKDYDGELDTRVDIMYEHCIEPCVPWEHFKIGVRKVLELTKNHHGFECVDVADADTDDADTEETVPEETPTDNKNE